jgi:hypothetical protein
MTNKNETEREDIIFLFGAGASVDADIPDTCRFVEDFQHYIKEKDSRLYKQLLKILEIREIFNKRNLGAEKKRVDVEQLLHTISRLIDRDNEVLLDFYEERVFNKEIAEDQQVLQNLKKILEDFIREKVIVEEEEKLEYLKELLKFTFPLEIYSVNYDTCIEQLSHMSHLRYTDGFDTYWDRANFSNKDFHVKHYKMHGSVIWYENKKTKECVKIPVHAFAEGKPARLRLIYGEDVEPLLIYPAQKMEYIEPLTELQLMFKERLIQKETKILVVVGYSFRDDYIIQMLWDAGRENDDLHIVLISPTAQEHFEEKLRFIDKNRKDSSRICNRVVCLPYPFSTIIYQLKNHYLQKLSNICRIEKQFIETQKYGVEPKWQDLLELCIECEFSTKAENILEEKIKWSELRFNLPQSHTLLGVKAMLHSVIAKDRHEEDWVKRVNESMKFLNIENLEVQNLSASGFLLLFKVEPNETRSFKEILEHWVASIIKERNDKLKLLGTRYENRLAITEKSFKRLEKFQDYLSELEGGVKWEKYFDLRSKSTEINEIRKLYPKESFPEDQFSKSNDQRLAREVVLNIERKELEKIFGGNAFQFRLQD